MRPRQLSCLYLADRNAFEFMLAQHLQRAAVERTRRRLLTFVLVALLEFFDQPSDRPFGGALPCAIILTGPPIVDPLILFLRLGCGSNGIFP